MKTIAQFLTKYLAVFILAVGAVALFIPATFSWIPPKSINWMLGIVMCGMGLNLKLEDFRVVFSRPKDVIIGCLAQFIIMPALAWGLSELFHLPTELAVGVILVGCCPGGTASNVITFLAKGDLALSVGMTTISTLLAPLLTPLLVLFYAGQSVDVDTWGMLLSITQVVILPIIIGIVLNYWFGSFAEKVKPYMPAVSTLAIATILGIVVSLNAERILTSSLIIILVVMLHNLCGLALGFLTGKVLGLERPQQTAISIEVGMQNSGLATSLAATHFAMFPLATIPGAIFSVWHNFSGALAASLFSRSLR